MLDLISESFFLNRCKIKIVLYLIGFKLNKISDYDQIYFYSFFMQIENVKEKMVNLRDEFVKFQVCSFNGSCV